MGNLDQGHDLARARNLKAPVLREVVDIRCGQHHRDAITRTARKRSPMTVLTSRRAIVS
jgi:hypothetical protein